LTKENCVLSKPVISIGSDDDDDGSSRERSSLESGSSLGSSSEGEEVGRAGKMAGEGMSMGELIQQAKMQSLFDSKVSCVVCFL